MKPLEIYRRRSALGWSRYRLSKFAGLDPRSVIRAEAGDAVQRGTYAAIQAAIEKGEEVARRLQEAATTKPSTGVIES